jgi:hypothetical protein
MFVWDALLFMTGMGARTRFACQEEREADARYKEEFFQKTSPNSGFGAYINNLTRPLTLHEMDLMDAVIKDPQASRYTIKAVP